ncbi:MULTISPECIES: type II toxin-antitoxin system Phd/YefM family antitoxin [unclassified Shinella]|uniref:type II toxin-antitoxin system Phd/YefM family antitoxin n=1 Tax=unclassified Shinella TaxID=2643062 RepID=UPI00225D4F66|nr:MULTISPECIES: type II toxin-antitoxin system Phd/YefM family antitoxin [unclassified Shinella]CAI0338761.1 Prevent-host-death family protein [Rhizobiaceae bacterium]CAK7257192.1 Antitoxin [Shinella sp. WSC3-e]MCO5139345.1 type II toxin-antitoxin system Phd/YefM family antitoxin [Shinella sp.]MCW5711667.1 type II toxin-antitoxin system Phd/YefM family antitoxin [Shinella sp.]MDC7255926.1 type II toxin-antitoxin system Phd/YefM family antitoxin [Shinella sp. YE25]
MAVMSSREFNQDTGKAKRAAENGPVFITDRGRPGHVLLSIEDYRRLISGEKTLADLLAMPSGEDVEFDPPKLSDIGVKPADLG